jgi:signal transduction histidine kinase
VSGRTRVVPGRPREVSLRACWRAVLLCRPTWSGTPEEGGAWRAVDIFRIFGLGYAIVLFVPAHGEFVHPVGAAAVLAVMAAWTAWLTVRRARPRWLLWTDLMLAVACVLATAVVDDPARIAGGATTLPSMWAAAPVASFAVGRGWLLGVVAAGAVSLADVVEVWPRVSSNTVDSVVQLMAIGAIVGYTAELYETGRQRLAAAAAVDAATRERERLAGDIHDSVLQVLAYVQRRGSELGGEAAEIGRLAGQQEIQLRAMVSARQPRSVGEADLAALLSALAGPGVSVAVPADPVAVPAGVAGRVLAAVRTALDNVERHAGAGARAWVLLEDEVEMVTITVRDDGAGMPAGRLAAAAAEGRLGIAAGIRGRLQEVGGTLTVTAAPGEGTELEFRVPRRART